MILAAIDSSYLDAWNALLNVIQTVALTYIAARWGEQRRTKRP